MNSDMLNDFDTDASLRNGVRTIQEIYDAYRIMPNIALHQLRAAAVGKTICDAMIEDLDSRKVILACLCHDLGNIIKADFSVFPEFCEPEGVAHWELVKKEFIETYGPDEHEAARIMARRAGIPESVIAIIDGIGFSRMEETRDSGSLELKICEYADQRVGPHGVISMNARIMEAQKRYENRRNHFPKDQNRFDALVAAAHDIENQIFSRTAIGPDDITEQSIQATIEELRSYPVA